MPVLGMSPLTSAVLFPPKLTVPLVPIQACPYVFPYSGSGKGRSTRSVVLSPVRASCRSPAAYGRPPAAAQA